MTQVLLTGSSGFVGRCLCSRLLSRNYLVREVARQKFPFNNSQIITADIGPYTNWNKSLTNVDIVIHLAARVHVIDDNTTNPLAAFREVNTFGTEHLAREAAKAGVRRFIFLSSIKVNGEKTAPPHPNPLPPGERELFRENDLPNPRDPYAVSKWHAEQLLHDIAAETGMEVVIIRPPLVYGPEVKANFLRLLQFVAKGLPLPFGGIQNKRSLVFLDNLVDFILCCLEHPAAAGETFLVSDGEDLSTPELIKRIAFHMNRPTRLFPIPENLLQLGAKLTGKTAEVDRLCGSLQVDISKAKRVLGWEPPFSADEGLAKTVDWFMARGVKS